MKDEAVCFVLNYTWINSRPVRQKMTNFKRKTVSKRLLNVIKSNVLLAAAFHVACKDFVLRLIEIQFLNSSKRNSMISRRKFLKMQKVTQI